MRLQSPLPARLLSLLILALLGCGALASGARADTLPFTDAHAVGYIGFCDGNGKPITSGNINQRPFVQTAISSSPAPVGFGTKDSKAVLYAFQPIEGLDPGDWTGKQLTAPALFTNPDHPMSDAIATDSTMADFVSVTPPHWQGLVELRLYYFSPTKGQHTTTYPATVVRVTGQNWTVVRGSTVACDVGKATSVAKIYLPKTTVPPQQPSGVSRSGAGKSSDSASPSVGSSAGSVASPSASMSAGNSVQSGSAAAKASSSSSTHGALIIACLVALAAVGTTGFFVWRHHRLG